MPALMCLPRELRDLIIDQAIYSTPQTLPHVSTSRAEWKARGSKIPLFPTPAYSGLLLTCRQLCHETRDRLQRQPCHFIVDCLFFDHLQVVYTWLLIPPGLPGRSLIERLDINFRFAPIQESDHETCLLVHQLSRIPPRIAAELSLWEMWNPVSRIIHRLVSGGHDRVISASMFGDGAPAKYFIREVRINLARSIIIVPPRPHYFKQVETNLLGENSLPFKPRALNSAAWILKDCLYESSFTNQPLRKFDRSLSSAPYDQAQLYITRVGDIGFYIADQQAQSLGIADLIRPNPVADAERALPFRKELENFKCQQGEHSEVVKDFISARSEDYRIHIEVEK